jgi:hypothetical protein
MQTSEQAGNPHRDVLDRIPDQRRVENPLRSVGGHPSAGEQKCRSKHRGVEKQENHQRAFGAEINHAGIVRVLRTVASEDQKNQKPETRNPNEIPNPKEKQLFVLDFGFRVSFGFLVSDFGFYFSML